MKEKFVKMLEESVELDEAQRGRPKKEVTDEVPKEKGKRGRPKQTEDDKDDSGKEGVRDVKLVAKIKIGKKIETAEKVLKDFNVDKIEDEIKKYERELHKKYKYDADDVTITKHIGKYEVEDKADQHMTRDDDGSDEEDGYSLGRKDK